MPDAALAESAQADADKPVTKPEIGSLVPQPNGRGALRYGSKPGTNGGPPPSLVRAAAREAWFARLPRLEQIADGGDATETVRAMAELSKVGMGGTIGVDDIRERLRAQVQVIRATLPADQAQALLTALGDVWK